MDKIFEIATKIATPLALSGLLSAAFFLVARQIIEKNIFPKLTKQLSSQIIKIIIDRLFILSLVTIILGFIGYVIPVSKGNFVTPEKGFEESKNNKPDLNDLKMADSERLKDSAVYTHLKLVDIHCIGDKVDFKMKNSGNDSAFLTEIYFLGTLYRTMSNCSYSSAILYEHIIVESKNDSANIGKDYSNQDNRNGYFEKKMKSESSLKLSQVVPPRSVDRFVIKFSLPENMKNVCPSYKGFHGYAVIRYDKDKELQTEEFTVEFDHH